MVQWCGGAVVPWCGGAVMQWCSGAVVRCCSGAVVQWCGGAVVQWCCGAVVQWCGGAVVSWRNSAVVQWCGLVVAACISDWRVPIWCLALRTMLRADLVRGRVSTFASNVSLWCVSFFGGRAVSWIFPVSVLCNVRFMSVVSLFIPDALYLYSLFVAV